MTQVYSIHSGNPHICIFIQSCSDTLNVEDHKEMAVDASQYFQNIGPQYAPMMRLFLGLMVTVTAAYDASFHVKKPIFKRGVFFASNVFYFLNHSAAGKRASEYMTHIDADTQKVLWSLPDKALFRRASLFVYPHIEVSGNFQVTFEKDEDQVDENIVKSKYIKTLHEGIPSTVQNVSVRIIKSQPLKSKYSDTVKMDYPVMTKFLSMIHHVTPHEHRKDHELHPGFMFHVHGGGFMALTSFSHEPYLRQWVTHTNLRILSVDYTRTPDQHFPVQLEECYQAYKWILKNGSQDLGLHLEKSKIIFVGDSAGGNIVSALLMRIIEEDKLRRPDALVLAYPAMYLEFSPSPARIMSTLDPLLNTSILKMCGDEYISKEEELNDPSHDAKHNPYISPAVIPDDTLKQFPPTLISTGALDPLFDDAWYFAKRLEQANGENGVSMHVYDTLGHGYLNLVTLIPEARVASERISDWVRDNVLLNEQ
ncbi:lipase [Acrasis kona]|uniref:Lipase n=1 Tax=Acrasis kona TaxID=1008807 RepID=A0AAW2Z6G6_9EUKA